MTPVSSNTLAERCGWFTRVTRTRIGSPYVIAAMSEERDAGAERVVGYEANGGFLTMMPIESDGRMLEALPTRDAVIVALAVLLTAIRRGVAISQLLDLLPSRFTASDRLKEFPSEISQARIAALETSQDSLLERFPDLGAPASIDTTDGLRITFGNDEILHLRPSGNAPELRCYTEAATAERARTLNADCLAWLDGWRE